jgi:Response regulator containing CheY-like receiver domain and AraC-type DNA-binding domain
MEKRILIVEDEIVLSMAMGRMLKAIGYSVIGSVTNGEEALELAKRDRPDIVAMDIRLAGKMDGVEAATRIIEESGCAIVFMTGYDDDGTKERALKLRPLGFMSKPIDRKKLEALLMGKGGRTDDEPKEG